MKRLFLLTSFVLASIFSVQAQTTDRLPQTSAPVAGDALQKGNWLVGGSLGSLGLDFGTGNFQVSLFPTAGYFLSDQAVLGAQTNFALYSNEGGTDVSYGFSPFIRYYLGAGARDTGRFFGELGLGGAGSALRGTTDSAISFLLGLRAGYAHFVGENVALESTVGYTFSGAEISTPYNVSGLNFAFGFQIYLPGRRNR
jgi:hypothetical protein